METELFACPELEIEDGPRGWCQGPLRGLFIALLFDGMQRYVRFLKSRSLRESRDYAESARWIQERDSDYFLSFEQVCEGLGLDADYLRGGLVRAPEAFLRAKQLR